MFERGLVHIYTGNGKGKTSAAIGLAVRARGAGLRVCWVPFLKGGEESAEYKMLRTCGVCVEPPALSPTGLLRGGVSSNDIAAALRAFDIARNHLQSDLFDVIILDELCGALHHGLLNKAEVICTIEQRIKHIEVVLTGRNAPEELLAISDLVTEMKCVKHPLKSGVPARHGIEY